MEHQNAVSVSNRQYVLLRRAHKGGIPLEDVLGISQTTAGSIVRRGLLAWSKKVKLFVLTTSGESLLQIYRDVDLSRKNQKAPLSKWIRKDHSNVRAINSRAAKRKNRAA